jgi:hypothetical protein
MYEVREVGNTHSLEIKILQGAGRSSRLIGLTRAIVLVPRESQRITVTAPSLDSYLISRFSVPQPYSAAWPAKLPLSNTFTRRHWPCVSHPARSITALPRLGRSLNDAGHTAATAGCRADLASSPLLCMSDHA